MRLGQGLDLEVARLGAGCDEPAKGGGLAHVLVRVRVRARARGRGRVSSRVSSNQVDQVVARLALGLRGLLVEADDLGSGSCVRVRVRGRGRARFMS